jgi:hypothetical protein
LSRELEEGEREGRGAAVHTYLKREHHELAANGDQLGLALLITPEMIRFWKYDVKEFTNR